jgi:hypothetical protein
MTIHAKIQPQRLETNQNESQNKGHRLLGMAGCLLLLRVFPSRSDASTAGTRKHLPNVGGVSGWIRFSYFGVDYAKAPEIEPGLDAKVRPSTNVDDYPVNQELLDRIAVVPVRLRDCS